MKSLKLFIFVFVFFVGIFSFVNAQSYCADGGPFINCSIGETCQGPSCVCTANTPSTIYTGDICGSLCHDNGVFFECDTNDFCSNDECVCNGSIISSGNICTGVSIASCEHAGQTFYEGDSRQRFLSGPIVSYGNSCQVGIVTCTSSGLAGDTGYLFTGCIVDPTPPLNTGSCNLPGYGTMFSGDILTGFSQSSVPCGSVCPSYNTIVCLDGTLSGGSNFSEVQHPSCYSVSCGGGGGGGGSSSYVPICDLEDLICVDGEYEERDGVNCRNGELGESCEILTGDENEGIDVSSFDRIGDISNSNYSSELNLAYLYAYNMGITTMSNIFDANMEGNLIRSHMAKMLVEWAQNVMGLDVNTEIVCDFDDIDTLQGQDLYDFVIQSCQMGLMGLDDQGNPSDSFRPGDVVTRAQFGTVLSRAIWGDHYNGGSPYYKDHLHTLNDIEIMNNISDPWMLELRGYVMLMLFRANSLLN